MATETLRPNAAGAECNVPNENGLECPDHYLNVDEAVPDNGVTAVWNDGADYLRDLYNVDPSGVGAGTINHITVYVRCITSFVPTQESLKICIRSNSTVTEDVEQTLSTSWALYSKQWATNPADAGAWEWADIDALQIGISIRTPGSGDSLVDQIYVVVDYEPALAVGRSFGFIIG